MPNWCDNSVLIRHEDQSKIDFIIEHQDGILEALFPCPAVLVERGCPCPEEVRAQNLAEFGYGDWYEWREAHWGTKWDMSDVCIDAGETPNEIWISFQSPWCPPTNAYERMKEMGYYISAEYEETGNCFKGTWIDGVDDCWDTEPWDEEEE